MSRSQDKWEEELRRAGADRKRAAIVRWLREEVAPDLGDERRHYIMITGIADAIDAGAPEKWAKSQEGGGA